MIDGIQFTFHTSSSRSHLLELPCWKEVVWKKNRASVYGILSANLRGLDLKLKPSFQGGYRLFLNGSLHKFHNCGEDNVDQFSMTKLVQSLDSLTDLLKIQAEKCELHGIEIGVNIQLPFSPLRVLKNLVSYRSRPFGQINKRTLSKGLQASLSQYRVKVYDKAKLSGIDCGNILRFEVAVDKMQVLKEYKLSTLNDLYNVKKVYPLVKVLQDTLKGIIWTDTTTDLRNLSSKEQKEWLSFSNPKTWQNMEKRERYKALKKWDLLLKQHGSCPDLSAYILKTWENLFEKEWEAEIVGLFYQNLQRNEAGKLGTILPLECTVKKSQLSIQLDTFRTTTFSDKLNIDTLHKKSKRKDHSCLSCGQNISGQKKNTIFCSEKLYGQAAKSCRNKNSNARRNKKRLIESARRGDSHCLIIYTWDHVNTFSEVLHPSEIDMCRTTLDCIRSIEHL